MNANNKKHQVTIHSTGQDESCYAQDDFGTFRKTFISEKRGFYRHVHIG